VLVLGSSVWCLYDPMALPARYALGRSYYTHTMIILVPTNHHQARVNPVCSCSSRCLACTVPYGCTVQCSPPSHVPSLLDFALSKQFHYFHATIKHHSGHTQNGQKQVYYGIGPLFSNSTPGVSLSQEVSLLSRTQDRLADSRCDAVTPCWDGLGGIF
jgi:hypothetical protein